DLAGGVQGLGRQGLGRALEMVGSGLGFGGRSQVGRTVGGLMRSGGIQMQRDADEGRRQRTQADRDTQRGQELTTRERHGEYQGYARQMTGDPKTQRDVVAAMDILSETWGHQRVREALPAVTHAMGLATGRGGAAGEGGGRTSLPRLAEERGYVNPAGQPLPQHFVAGEVERELIGRHGAQGAPQFSPPQAGRVAPGQAPPSRPGIVPGLGQHSPPDYFDYREGGTRIAEALGVGTEREAVRVYGNLYSSLRQDAPLRNTAAATDPRDDRLALANGLVTEAPRIAAQARTAGADVQAAFVQHVDGLAAQHGLTGADLGDTWVQHAARFRTT
ncbi:MAG: hypothetical protein KKB13_11070, partial [Chloroflexi bacterium]|nr:hypothetical protein [Chloroflexota bacterium]